ncbi:ABC transporter substrate-binding protein [Arthrobacter sp. ISL-30]|uniref:ABC transporter substrate-binding protein n=1 Tax=Arthrobacter sp. ISL-30 TaxID=2819109 RepID=UPI001BE8652A|nr:ABC transporter substrate-binding protein [Arthrobacter sp. ISL-30]MBT2513724.1 ABC transporter substrate-binding protein [Arthrobacter sp. ISL-30]
MSHPIDVGSVLGGRYRVTATVLTSHDQDLVLDGVDQVLNRPVSILVAGPGNAEQVAQSAREVATGERPGNVQILDLGVSDNTTYLITNHSSAPDLLDLVVAANPPYVEPFFTDTLGSEIFGQARSREPEAYDGLYDDEEDAQYITYDDDPYRYPSTRPAEAAPASDHDGTPSRNDAPAARRAPLVPPMPPSKPASPPGSGIAARLAAAAAGAGAAASAAAAAVKSSGNKASSEEDTAGSGARPTPSTAPQDVQPSPATQPFQAPKASMPMTSTESSEEESPKVSLWSEEDYGFVNAGGASARGAGSAEREQTADRGRAVGAAGALGYADSGNGRDAGRFPSTPDREEFEDEDYDDEPEREPRSLRWLVGGILAAVLVIGLILAVTNLGSFLGQPAATEATTSAPSDAGTSEPSPSASTAPAAGPPAIEGITRLGSFDFAQSYDKDLPKAFDGNAASYWSDMEFANQNWGGFATEVPLVVKLKAPSKVNSITLSQLGASGGSISVFTNDRPAMDGAKHVGTNSFTSPDLTMPLNEPVTAQYVIISIKSLPKLAAPKTQFGFGLRLAEIKVQ